MFVKLSATLDSGTGRLPNREHEPSPRLATSDQIFRDWALPPPRVALSEYGPDCDSALRNVRGTNSPDDRHHFFHNIIRAGTRAPSPVGHSIHNDVRHCSSFSHGEPQRKQMFLSLSLSRARGSVHQQRKKILPRRVVSRYLPYRRFGFLLQVARTVLGNK